ncbi:MAG TPA: PKD domain-containing protein [Deltaproteobacteria bacterium]|nr:PKD domain-containing protein [Deltaproteobacteria bacterium]
MPIVPGLWFVLACGGGGVDPDPGEAPPPGPGPVAEAGPPQQVWVGEAVSLDGSASQGASTYRWDLGNGIATESSPDATATVTFDAPGRYSVVLTVADELGRDDTDNVLISVTHPATHVPRQSSTVVVFEDQIAVVSPDSDELARLTWSETGALTLLERHSTAGNPRTVAPWSPAGAGPWLAVPCQDDAVIELIGLDGAPDLSVALPRGSRPYGIVGDDEALFVSLQATGQLARIELEPGGAAAQLVATYDAVDDARGVAVLPDGRIAVTRWRSGPEHAEIAVLRPDGSERGLWTLAFDEQRGSDTESGGVPSYLNQLLISPNGLDAVVPSLQANLAAGPDDNPLTHETTVRAVISYLDPLDGTEHFELRKQFDDRGFAAAGVFSSRGDYLFVAMRGSRSVDRVDVLSGGVSGSFLDVGYTPEGLALSPDDRFLFVNSYLSRELLVYDAGDLSAPPVAIDSATIPSAEPLSAEVLWGKQLFNDSFDTRIAKDGYIACAHCHLEGADDGHTWDFTSRGEGLRNTISLIGRGGEAPLHWSGNFDEVQDFEHDIRGAFGGTGLMEDADFEAGTRSETLGDPKAGVSDPLDALAAYVSSLDQHPISPHRAPDGGLTPEAEQGKLLFESPALGCTTCHLGPQLADSRFIEPTVPLLYDVGTLTPASGGRLGGPLWGIDTPTLHGLWATAPYLHDGSAPDLYAVLTTKNPDDLHGVTSGLGATELDALVAYLLSLDGAVD